MILQLPRRVQNPSWIIWHLWWTIPASKMSNIPIRRCADQARRDPKWTGRSSEGPCYFPTDEEKEWNVQFCLVHALTDSDLVKELLTLDLKTTTAKMLETCSTQIAIADNLNARDLVSKTLNAVIKRSKWPQYCPQQQQEKTSNPQNQHACGNCTKFPCTCQGLHMPDMWQNLSLGCQMLKHHQ